MAEVHIDWLADEDFGPINAGIVTSEWLAAGAIGILAIGGMKRCLISLEAVPSSGVESVDVGISLIEGVQSSAKIAVIDAGSHGEVGVQRVDHVGLP